jgi:methyl-accepting chemotaxis protein
MQEKQEKTQKLVENAYRLINFYYNKSEAREISPELARRYALETIKVLSSSLESYFWVMDTHPTMVMHPIRPEMDGLDLTDYVGPDGKKLFLDMVSITKQNGAGFIQYEWTKPHTKDGTLYPKISYIKEFKPWDWIVGSGVYVDDIDSAFLNAVYLTCGVGLVILMFLVSLAMTAFSRNRQ